MHPSEMYMLPLILGGLLAPKSNTNVGLPSLTDSRPQPFVALEQPIQRICTWKLPTVELIQAEQKLLV